MTQLFRDEQRENLGTESKCADGRHSEMEDGEIRRAFVLPTHSNKSLTMIRAFPAGILPD